MTKDEQKELASVFDYQRGTHVLHGTIQYLHERREYEDHWLDVLSTSTVPATMIWGKLDPVAVTAVANYVWIQDLKYRHSAPATLHWLEDANHYLQVDHAEEVAAIVRDAISSKTETNKEVFHSKTGEK